MKEKKELKLQTQFHLRKKLRLALDIKQITFTIKNTLEIKNW